MSPSRFFRKSSAMNLETFLSGKVPLRSIRAGETVISEGAQADAAYLIREGTASVYHARKDGSEALLAHLGPEDLFGEMALLRYDRHTLSVRAESDLELYVIEAALLFGQLNQTPPLIRAILDALLDRVHETNEALIDISADNG